MVETRNNDVLNKHPSTLIVGYGVVGKHIGKYFTEADWIDELGVFRKVKGDVETKPLSSYKIGFISVPTPMLPSGQCDTSILEDAIKKYASRVNYWCSKSTVEVGTTDRLAKKYGLKMCMSPEYLGETLGHPLVEAIRDPFVILGGEPETTRAFADAWTTVTNSYAQIYQVSAKTAELCKLMENSFIATKVMFCNEFYGLAQEVGVDYNVLREVFLLDPRVGRSHTYVFENNRGFSGKCLPKDINNLVWFYKNKGGEEAKLMKFLLEYNADMRKGTETSVPLLGEDI